MSNRAMIDECRSFEICNDPKQDTAQLRMKDIHTVISTTVEKLQEKLELARLSWTPQTHG